MNTSSQSSEDEADAKKVLHLLTLAWINEKNSPELLKHETELVNCMMDQIQQMEENMQRINHDDFRMVPCQMEVDRIRFIISSYLRTRLEKTETFTANLLRQDRNTIDDNDKFMSEGEFTFAESYFDSLQTYINNTALRFMPQILQEFNENTQAMEIKPNIDSYVFIKMVETVNSVMICDKPTTLLADSRHLLPYSSIAEHLNDGKAFLI